MGKKIRFVLDMGNGMEASDLESLRSCFHLSKVKEYFLDGRLQKWLEDRYYDDILDSLEMIQPEEDDLGRKLCEVFGVEYTEDDTERRQKLSEYTDEEEILNHADKVAFCQDELADLLDQGEKIIYLCGKEFSIPTRVHDIHYIGVNTPIVRLKLKDGCTLESCGITFENVEFDSTLADMNAAQERKQTEIVKDMESVDNHSFVIEKIKKGNDMVYELFYYGDGEEVCISEMGKGTTMDFCRFGKDVFYAKCSCHDYEMSGTPKVEIYRYNMETGERAFVTKTLTGKKQNTQSIAYIEDDGRENRHRYMFCDGTWLYLLDDWARHIQRIKMDGSRQSNVELESEYELCSYYDQPRILFQSNIMGVCEGLFGLLGEKLFVVTDDVDYLGSEKHYQLYVFNTRTRKCMPVCIGLQYIYLEKDCAYVLLKNSDDNASAVFKMERDQDELVPIAQFAEVCTRFERRNGVFYGHTIWGEECEAVSMEGFQPKPPKKGKGLLNAIIEK